MAEKTFNEQVIDSLDTIVGNSSLTLYSQTADRVIANTTDEISGFNSTGAKGTLTIPANYLKSGTEITIRLTGRISTGIAQPAQLKTTIDGATIDTSVGTLPSNLSDGVFDVYFYLTVRSSGPTGTIVGQGRTLIAGTGIGTIMGRPLTMLAPAVIDTTNPLDVNVTYKWTNAIAANSVTITNASISIIN